MRELLLTLAVLSAVGSVVALGAQLAVAMIIRLEVFIMGDDWPVLRERFPVAEAVGQKKNLARARDRIAPLIRAFWKERREGGGEFHADDLRDYVRTHLPAAPASPDRILRAMRQDGEIDYVVLNRKASHYRFVYPEGEQCHG